MDKTFPVLITRDKGIIYMYAGDQWCFIKLLSGIAGARSTAPFPKAI